MSRGEGANVDGSGNENMEYLTGARAGQQDTPEDTPEQQAPAERRLETLPKNPE